MRSIQLSRWIWVVVLAFAVTSAAHAQSFKQSCEGTLHMKRGGLYFGGEVGESEDVCIVAQSQAIKVKQVCTVGKYCSLVGIAGACQGSGECAQINKVLRVTTSRSSKD